MSECLKLRRTGRSTAIALDLISKAYNNPNKQYTIKDHYGTRESDKYLMYTIKDIIDKLGFTGFEFNLSTISFKYIPLTPIKVEFYNSEKYCLGCSCDEKKST